MQLRESAGIDYCRVSIISTLASSLAAQLPQLIPCAVQMILTLVTSLISNLPQLITSGLNLMKGPRKWNCKFNPIGVSEGTSDYWKACIDYHNESSKDSQLRSVKSLK